MSILYRWVAIQPQDFQIDATLRDNMRTFLMEEVTEEEFQSEVNRIKAILEFQVSFYLLKVNFLVSKSHNESESLL